MTTPITILAARYWPEAHGGVETHLWHFSRQLAKAGVRVQVMAESRSRSPEHEVIGPGHSVWRRSPVDPGRLWRWRPLVRLRWWHQWLQKNPPEGAIWATDPVLATATILAGHGHRMIYNPAGCVGAMRHVGRVYDQVTSMRLPWVTQWIDRVAYRRARRVVVSSVNVKNQYIRYYGIHDHMYVMPLAVAPATDVDPIAARRQWKIDNDAFVIGFVGRLDPCKGLDFLFEAAQTVGLRDCTRILIVGDGPDQARLRRVVKQAGLSSHIIWAGQMPDPASAYAAMDVLVLPSIYEAFGLVALEAMTHGVPVLARGGDGLNVLTAADEIIEQGHSGFVVDGHDPLDLARRLIQLESAPHRCRAMGDMARHASHLRTWQRYTHRCLTELFDQASMHLPEKHPFAIGRHAA